MRINTIKRNIKGAPLSHAEFDSNWSAIEDAINAKAIKELYQIVDVAESFHTDETTGAELLLQFQLKVLYTLWQVPVIKFCVTVNGKLTSLGGSTDLFVGNNYPVLQNENAYNLLEVNTSVSNEDWPALIKVYITDDGGNYCNTYEVYYSENPL